MLTLFVEELIRRYLAMVDISFHLQSLSMITFKPGITKEN
jgi:hypothetical protein